MKRAGKMSVVVALILCGTLAGALEWVPDTDTPVKTKAPAVEQPPAEQPAETGARIAWAESFEPALAQSKAEAKPLMIVFSVDYQQWCKTFDEKTLADPGIVALADKFVCVRVNGKTKPDLVKKYKVDGYPTVVFLNPRGEVVDRVIGFLPAQPFLVEDLKPVAEGRNLEKEFQELVQSNPREFRPMVLLGIGYAKRHDWDKAIGSYEEALRLGPGLGSRESQEIVYSLCQLYDYKGQSPKSEKLLLDLLKVDDSDKVKVHDMLAQTYISLKRPDEAIRHFQAERALVQDPDQQKFIDQMIDQVRKSMEKGKAQPTANAGS